MALAWLQYAISFNITDPSNDFLGHSHGCQGVQALAAVTNHSVLRTALFSSKLSFGQLCCLLASLGSFPHC